MNLLSLSSKMYNVACPLKSCALGGMWLMLLNKFDIVAWCFECKVGRFLLAIGCNISIRVSHQLSAGIPSIRKPGSGDTISDSVLPWDTAVRFLLTHEIGPNVCVPKMHKTPPDVDLESERIPKTSAAWHKPMCNHLLCYPHDSTASLLLYDEYNLKVFVSKIQAFQHYLRACLR